MQTPLVVFGIWLARESGGVQDTEVAEVLVAIVPLALPKVYVSVWVKDEEALLILIARAEPIVPFEAETEDALGMESRVIFALAVILL